MLSFLCVALILIEVVYIILPRGMQKKIEALDYTPPRENQTEGFYVSITTGLAGVFLLILVISVI